MTEHMKSPDTDGDGEKTLCGIPKRFIPPSLEKALIVFSGALSGAVSGCDDEVELRHDGKSQKIVKESYKNEAKHSSGTLDKGQDWARRTYHDGADKVDTAGWWGAGIGVVVGGLLLLRKMRNWFR